MTEIETTSQKEHPDLYKRSIKGGYWVVATRAATQLLGFVRSILVFNILFDVNLELIFVANLLMAALTTFSESGFQAALVQKKDDIESYLDTAWVIGIVRGFVLFAAVFFIAPLFAKFKVDPEVAPLAISVIRAMGLCFLIRAFQNIGVVYFQKEMDFHKTFLLTMAGTVTDIVISITLLLIYENVWAVVISRLVTAVVNLTMSYGLCDYRPRFHFVPEKARELWKFGKWLFGGNILGYLLNEGADWFVLFFFTDSLPFKLYLGSRRFTNIPTIYITNTTSQVSFPAYSKIQDDIPRLRNAYLKVLKLTALVSVPLAFMIFILGPDFVRLFLVEKSHGMAPIVQILAFKGLLISIGATRGSLFRAIGVPYINFHLRILRLIIFLVSLYPLTRIYGIMGTAIATLLYSVITDPYGLMLVSRVLVCTCWRILLPLFIPVISSSIVLGGIIYLKGEFIHVMNYFSFFGLVLFFVVGYIVLILGLDQLFKTGASDVLTKKNQQF